MSTGRLNLMAGLLTTSEAAIELERSEDTLKRWRRNRTGPRFVTVAGRLYYREADLRAWVDAETFSGEPREP